MLFILLVVIIVCLVIIYLKLKKNNYWKKRNIVQIDDLLVKFMFGNNSFAEVCKNVYDEHDEAHIGTAMGRLPTLMLKDLKDIQAVLAGDFLSFHSRGFMTNSNDLLADNILFMTDFQRWKLMRQKLTPVFTSSRLKNMFYIIEKCARDFVDLVEDNLHLRQKPFNVLYTYTTASIGASVFGIDTQTRNTMESPFLDMAWKAVEPTMFGNFIIFIANTFPGLFRLLKLKIFGDHEEFFIGAVKTVLESRRHDTRERHDFIEICLELQKHGVMQDFATGFELDPTDELLAAQAFFFFIAGADTSANTMHFTLLELSNNPKILMKLHEEIDGIFENCGEELTYNDMDKLQYLDKVVNEAMRKYPPIGIMQRLCTKETVLPTGVRIAKDDAVLIPVYALHRDEKFYPNPEVFEPERFSPENAIKIKKYAYLPFGEGNRICIGELHDFCTLYSFHTTHTRLDNQSPVTRTVVISVFHLSINLKIL